MATFQLLTAGLHQAMSSTDYASPISITMVGCDWWNSTLIISVGTCSPVSCSAVFLQRWHAPFMNFDSFISVDIARVSCG